jgi:glycerophosphoryl diester phosphodiesterase
MKSRFEFLDGPRPIAFAHRGHHRPEGPDENTLDAFDAAIRLGYRYLETDVHLSRDGVVVAFHDDVLDRVTDLTGAISDRSLAEIRSARTRHGGSIPTLAEVFEEFPDARVNIDPKHDEVLEALVEVIRRHRAVDRVCIAAFSDDRIARARALLGPRLCTSLGPREIARLLAASRMGGRPRFVAGAVQVPVRHRGVEIVTPRFVDRAHAVGLQVHVWTIDHPAEMHRLLDLCVDGIMTDRAEVLRAVLEERGVWAG